MACAIVCFQTYIVWSIMKRRHYHSNGVTYNGHLVPNSMQLGSENEEDDDNNNDEHDDDDCQIVFEQRKEQYYNETCA